MNSSLREPDVDFNTSTSKPETSASRFNGNLMRKLWKSLETDLETDLLSLFPTNYLDRLRRQKKACTSDNAIVKLKKVRS